MFYQEYLDSQKTAYSLLHHIITSYVVWLITLYSMFLFFQLSFSNSSALYIATVLVVEVLVTQQQCYQGSGHLDI